MAVRRVVNDPRAPYVGGASNNESADGSQKGTKTWLDQKGRVFLIGRGETNPFITYTAQFNAAGVLCYTYPNADGDGTITSTVLP